MRQLLACFAISLAGLTAALPARANVYATNPKLNNAAASLVTAKGNGAAISYILNEAASLGVTVQIFSTNSLVRALNVPANTQGTFSGTNVVTWDGKDADGNAAPYGVYSITITTAATGHTNWTQISSDSQPGAYVYYPQGIAVDNNSNSFYYGRVFVGNSETGPNFRTVPGDNDTILKLNANGTFAADGPEGNGGYPIVDEGDFANPQKMRMGDDDRLYMNDLDNQQVASFDPALSGSRVVFSQANYANNPFVFVLENPSSFDLGQYGWFSMDVTGAGTTNGLLWMGDADAGGAGVWFWHLTNGIADPNDTTGTQAVAVGGSLTTAASGGMMIDSNLDIFVSQGDPNDLSMDFTNAQPGQPFTTPATNSTAWLVGAGDTNFQNVFDTSIDSRQNPQYVACALAGPSSQGIRILSAATGSTLTNLDTANQYFVTAWDNVGNLYGASASLHRWRVFSPPTTTNQATTPVTETIQVVETTTILSVTADTSNITLVFTGSSEDPTNAFTLQGSPEVQGPYTAVTGTVITTNAFPGFFTATAPQNGATGFYRIKR